MSRAVWHRKFNCTAYSYEWCGEKSLKLFLFNSSVHHFNIRLASLVASRDVLGHARKNVTSRELFLVIFAATISSGNLCNCSEGWESFSLSRASHFLYFMWNFFIFLRISRSRYGEGSTSAEVTNFHRLFFFAFFVLQTDDSARLMSACRANFSRYYVINADVIKIYCKMWRETFFGGSDEGFFDKLLSSSGRMCLKFREFCQKFLIFLSSLPRSTTVPWYPRTKEFPD